ncbi:TIGR00730 family Rossman fold protein [uncultured Legionella sp.]|uniref:LOG family protein n=1 Tax=uncultured Legionella sp. TaxID=210934 RepID=UPI00260EC368|nr:TIGR00730 family Rossman fold protein [uncultured Legionella sp.]
MKSVCVYLGANFGKNEAFKVAVVKLGNEIADMGLTLVYGGSSLGMMGLLATTVKESGGKVIGVITSHLIKKEKPLEILDELHIVESMQERKKMMQNLADAFIVMPGGIGTLEEAIETWNAIKIGEIDKNIGFLNVDGFFDGLFSFVNNCQKNGFLTEEQESIPHVSSNVNALINALTEMDEVVVSQDKTLTLV